MAHTTPTDAEVAAIQLGTAAKRHVLASPMRTNLLLEALLVATVGRPIPDPHPTVSVIAAETLDPRVIAERVARAEVAA